MKYINENENKLIIKKGYYNNTNRSYWITITYKSMPKKDASIHPISMSMQVFVKDGEIINRSITLKETPHIISATTHNHEDVEVFDVDKLVKKYDESFVEIDYRDLYNVTSKKNNMVLDNIRISDEEEEIILKELFEEKNIKINMVPFKKVFQKSLSELNSLTEEKSEEESKKIYEEYKENIEEALKPFRLDIIKQKWQKQKYERNHGMYKPYIKK